MHFIRGDPTPGQVSRVIPDNGDEPAVDEIYLTASDGIPASSVGVTHDNTLPIGSITDRQLLVCGQRCAASGTRS